MSQPASNLAHSGDADSASSPLASVLGSRLCFPLAIVAIALVHHAAIALEYALHHGVALGEAICRWDCLLYADISRRGFHDDLWAFLPLFPESVGALSLATGLAPAWVGSALSAVCLVLFVVLVERFGRASPERTLLVPETKLGWFVMLYGPATYVLTTNHTESLFLLLSYAAFLLAARERPGLAGALAGLCVWTRNQGVFVAIACALLVASLASERRERVRRFLIAGATSFAFFLALLGFEALRAGSPFAYLAAQHHWTHAHSPIEVLRTFWFANPWQNHNPGSVLHHLYFAGLVALTWLCWRSRWPLGVYAALSLAVLPLQAELINAFRFGAVLFPLWFLAGDRLARAPRWLQVAAVVGLVALNHAVTRAYVSLHWAY